MTNLTHFPQGLWRGLCVYGHRFMRHFLHTAAPYDVMKHTFYIHIWIVNIWGLKIYIYIYIYIYMCVYIYIYSYIISSYLTEIIYIYLYIVSSYLTEVIYIYIYIYIYLFIYYQFLPNRGHISIYKKNSVALVRERTIPTEQPPPVGEVSANFCG